MAGGTKFGQPEPALQAQVTRLRYPTLQRVAHTLPADPKWRAHVVRSIRVLERSKDWDFKSKLEAMNRMKEVYDSLKPSEVYTAGLDEKLVVNRVASHIKRKYARDAEYVKTYRKRWLKEKSFYRYRPGARARKGIARQARWCQQNVGDDAQACFNFAARWQDLRAVRLTRCRLSDTTKVHRRAALFRVAFAAGPASLPLHH